MANNGKDFPNSGLLFKNVKKASGKHPDLKGDTTIDCPHCGKRSEWWASAWSKFARNGSKFLSLALTLKDDSKSARKARVGDPVDMPPASGDDDIPW